MGRNGIIKGMETFYKPYQAVTPWRLNQPWGTYDPSNYSQFGFTNHNGRDIAIGKDGYVRAPFNGTVVKNGFQPKGGGIFLGFISDDEFIFPNFACFTPE